MPARLTKTIAPGAPRDRNLHWDEDTLGARGEIIFSAAGACEYNSGSLGAAPKYLRKILEKNSWRRFIPPMTLEKVEVAYAEGEFEKFVHAKPPKGLGRSIDGLIRICEAQLGDDVKEEIRADAVEAIKLLREKQPALPQPGGDRREQDGNTILPTDGYSAPYALRRLKRDRPDLAQKVIDGKLSPHKAAIQAGFRRPIVQIPLDVEKAAQKLKTVFGKKDLKKLAERLLGSSC